MYALADSNSGSRVKVTVACCYCKLKKIKCTGVRPCSNCVKHFQECVFICPQTRRGPRKSDVEIIACRERRIAMAMEASAVSSYPITPPTNILAISSPNDQLQPVLQTNYIAPYNFTEIESNNSVFDNLNNTENIVDSTSISIKEDLLNLTFPTYPQNYLNYSYEN